MLFPRTSLRIESRPPRHRAVSRTETLVSISITAMLAIIALAVYAKQFRYDKHLFAAPEVNAGAPPGRHPGASAESDVFRNLLPADYKPLGPAEQFGAETLSDKINGKAELYLDAGFKLLHCRRFAAPADPAAWVEVFVYDMEKPANAFAVFSTQRRPEGEDVSGLASAYTAGNAVFFTSGPYYVETIAAEQSDAVMQVLTSIPAVFAEKHAAGGAEMPALQFLPQEKMMPGTLKLLIKDAFGFDKLDNVLVADYDVSGTTTTAFASARKTPGEAAALAESYYAMLTNDMGGEAVPVTTGSITGLKAVNLVGDYEIIFSSGSLLGGVHGSRSLDAALSLGETLYLNAAEKKK